MKEREHVPVKLYLQKQALGRIWPTARDCQALSQTTRSTREGPAPHVHLHTQLLSAVPHTNLLLTSWSFLSKWIKTPEGGFFMPLNVGLWHTYSDCEMRTSKFCQQTWQKSFWEYYAMSIQVVQALWQIRIMSKKEKKKRTQIVTETPTIHRATFIKHYLIVHYGLRCVKMLWHLLLPGKPVSGVWGLPEPLSIIAAPLPRLWGEALQWQVASRVRQADGPCELKEVTSPLSALGSSFTIGKL